MNIHNMLGNLLAKIGYVDILADDPTKHLIQEATRWACTFDLPECIYTANRELKKVLKHDNETHM